MGRYWYACISTEDEHFYISGSEAKVYKNDKKIFNTSLYDYLSCMYYPRASYSENGGDTITTIDAAYQDQIGNVITLAFFPKLHLDLLIKCILKLRISRWIFKIKQTFPIAYCGASLRWNEFLKYLIFSSLIRFMWKATTQFPFYDLIDVISWKIQTMKRKTINKEKLVKHFRLKVI